MLDELKLFPEHWGRWFLKDNEIFYFSAHGYVGSIKNKPINIDKPFKLGRYDEAKRWWELHPSDIGGLVFKIPDGYQGFESKEMIYDSYTEINPDGLYNVIVKSNQKIKGAVKVLKMTGNIVDGKDKIKTIEDKIRIAEGINAQTSYWENKSLTWNELKEKLKTPRRTQESMEQYDNYKKADRHKAKDGLGFVGGFCDKNKRTNETIATRSILTLDFDNCDKNIWNKLEQINFECVLYSTHSHRADKPKIRCIAPLTREINFNEYNFIMRKIVNNLSLWPEIDISCFKISQFMYYPSCSQDAEFYYSSISGSIINPADFLKPGWEDELLELRKEDTKDKKTTESKPGPKSNGREKTGPIGEFCRKYTITQVLDQFLSEFYEKGSKKNCYTWINGEGTDGLKILDDDSLCISYHGTDPAGNGQQCNSFDLIKIHLCNDDLSKAVKWCADKLGMNEAKTKENPDFTFVKWNPDYVMVKFTDTKDGPMTKRLSEYWNMYEGIEKKPKFEEYKVLPVIENVECLLRHYNLSLKYNIFKASFEIWVNNKIHRLDDHLVKIIDMGIKHGFKPPKEKILPSLIYIARKNKYNPVEDYLKNCHQYYLNNPDNDVFKQISDTITSDNRNKEKYIGRFLLQMVYLACSKEDSQTAPQHLLVLQGKQGIGKTTWFQNLLPQQLKSKYFLGGRVLELANKDHIMETITNWLCEIGEIASTFKKSDQEAFKNFVTAFKDKFRIPYAPEPIEQKRRTTLCATTNDVEYLKDLTGTRRFLTLACTKINYNHDVDIDMLWGYMYHLYLKNKPYWFTEKEIDEVIRDNDAFLSKPESITIIEEKFNLFPNEDGEWLKSVDIFEIIRPNVTISSKLNKFTITKELKKLDIKMKYDKHLKMNLFYVKRL